MITLWNYKSRNVGTSCNTLSHFHYSTCVEETAICNGTSVCDDQKDLQLCKNETQWKNTTEMAGYAQCNGTGQWITEQSANDGVFDCVNRRDEVPFKKTSSEKGELVKKTMYS